jgi:hypothetical protein
MYKIVKKKSIKKLKDKTWKVFSEYIRLRDCIRTMNSKDFGKCFTCSKIVPRTLLQSGHFVPGRHNANLFSEKGTHAQCYNCNINLHGNTLEYRRKIIELYGEGYDEILEQEARQTVKFTVEGLESLIVTYKEKIQQLLSGLE